MITAGFEGYARTDRRRVSKFSKAASPLRRPAQRSAAREQSKESERERWRVSLGKAGSATRRRTAAGSSAMENPRRDSHPEVIHTHLQENDVRLCVDVLMLRKGNDGSREKKTKFGSARRVVPSPRSPTLPSSSSASTDQLNLRGRIYHQPEKKKEMGSACRSSLKTKLEQERVCDSRDSLEVIASPRSHGSIRVIIIWMREDFVDPIRDELVPGLALAALSDRDWRRRRTRRGRTRSK